MFKLFISLIIILILLFPIKIKLTLFFDGNNLEVKLFKFKILEKNIDEVLLKMKNLKDEKSKNKKKKQKKKLHLLKYFNVKKVNLINNFIGNKYKPELIIYNNISYSLCDAAITGILYGLLNTIFYSFFATINLFFNLKIKFNKITPIFEDRNSISFLNKSIIKINFVQIIIMIVIIIKNIRFKGGPQKGNTYGK